MHKPHPLPDVHSRLAELLDEYAIGLSALCLLHCLGTPILVTLLPLSAYLSDSHWIHQLLVLLAAPATLWVAHANPMPFFVIAGLSGLGLLLVAAFVEALAVYELPMTVTGALLLGSVHLWHRKTSIHERHRRKV